MTTYTAIQHQEVGAGGASSITFSNIPQTPYTDLVLLTSLRVAKSDYIEPAQISFNGDSTNRTGRDLIGEGGSASSASGTRFFAYVTGATATTSTFANSSIFIPNYASSVAKSVSIDSVTENNHATNYFMHITAGLWNDTDPITSITLTPNTATTFVEGSSATLYGITRAALPTPTDVYSDSLLEEVVLTSSAASVTFSGLDAYAALGYTNLQIRAVGRSNRASSLEYVKVTFNGDTGTNYSWHQMYGDGASVYPLAGATQSAMNITRFTSTNADANAFGAIICDILDPFETTKYTTIRAIGGAHADTSNREVSISSGSWRNTAAVTSVTLTVGGGTSFNSATRFSLYGSK